MSVAVSMPGVLPPEGRRRLLVVDDEPEIRGMIAEYIGRDGIVVDTCASGAELDAALERGPADMVVLDVTMPGEDGLSIARRLRGTGSMPILMLTARDDIIDRVVGLEVGADDYLTKPFDLRELQARVRALLRRAAVAAEPAPAPVPEWHDCGRSLLCFGAVCLDRDNHCLVDRDGATHQLTTTEYYMLDTFARNPNRVLSRADLLEAGAGCPADQFARAVDIRIVRLRKKVEPDPAKPRVLRTVRNAGYVFVPPRTAP